MGRRTLRAGEAFIEVDDALVQSASVRSEFGPFEAEGAPALRLRRAKLSAGSSTLEGLSEPLGRFQIDADVLSVDVSDDPFAALAAVRLGYQLAVARTGGVMLHSSAVAFGPKAVLAVGPSGAGKSTLAKLLVDAGGRLLSDEINALLPSARIHGTPFRSDLERPGSPDGATLALVVTLEHGPHEVLKDVPAGAAMQAIASQTFRPQGAELSLSDAFGRLTRILDGVAFRRLVFRPLPAAAAVVKAFLDDSSSR